MRKMKLVGIIGFIVCTFGLCRCSTDIGFVFLCGMLFSILMMVARREWINEIEL